MRPPGRERANAARSFGAVVPEGFEDWHPPASPSPARGTARRRAAPRRGGGRPLWGRIEDDEIERVARQAADRRQARYSQRRGFLGRLRGSAPRRPMVADAWSGAGRNLKLMTVVVIICSAAAVLLFALPWLKVQRVEVAGSSVVPESALLAASGARPGESTFLLDTSAMTRNLLAQPWVASARVEVRWPSTVVLRVSPLPPVMDYERGGEQQPLAASGAVLAAPGEMDPEGLPLLRDERSGRAAPPGSLVLPSRLARALAALDHVFPASYGVQVKLFEITKAGALEIESSSGWTADLGLALTNSQIGSIAAKLEALRALSAQVNLQTAGIRRIYLEDPSQVVVSY